MCELTPTPYLAFLLPKKDGPRKKELLKQPKIKKGTNSKLIFNVTMIVKSKNSTL